MSATPSLFDPARVENDWRTTPTDLGGWSNRATAMFMLAKRYHAALERIAETDWFDGEDRFSGPSDVAEAALRGN